VRKGFFLIELCFDTEGKKMKFALMCADIANTSERLVLCVVFVCFVSEFVINESKSISKLRFRYLPLRDRIP